MSMQTTCRHQLNRFALNKKPRKPIRQVKPDKAKIKETDTIVAIKKYPINNKEAAITFLKSQLGKKYDYLGALGLALAPSRKWDEDDSWFCYELAANAISAGGGEQFSNLNHITETALLAIQSTDVTP